MEPSDYKIDLYQPEKISQVVDLLGESLWGGASEGNVAYFKWKYHHNPFARRPLGIIAQSGESIVGFRGYFATNWHLGNMNNKITILIPGDTVVRSDHQRRGLSVAMGRLAMERFASCCSVLLNTTATKKSIPGYLRMGFVPLGSKAYCRKTTLIRDANFMVKAALRGGKKAADLPTYISKIAFGEFGAIEVSKYPRPREMAEVISSDQQAINSIMLVQDEHFFRWRYTNPKGRYVFYFSKSGDQILGYLVVRLSADTNQGFILDYGQKEGGQIGRILDHIDYTNSLPELNIMNASIDEALSDTFKARGFKNRGLHHSARKWMHGDLPLLVRPVKLEIASSDWFLDDLDIRNLANWRFRHICQDDV